ncbi:8706_t:CDS:2 [Funneliformis mosseae]|uniref:8706_t:CDS:1 n=1 Tax=Funneliformis mosseae TaxID=27381 RepID=A0A9N8Z1J1_FUNMO|nr:8706_t:CDS:2 [Funneliformis mosseae]
MIIPVLFLFFLSPTQSANFTHFESENPLLSPKEPRVSKIVNYADGTVVLRTFRRNDTATKLSKEKYPFLVSAGYEFVCSDPLLSLRIIYPNGSLSEVDVDIGSIELNYCAFKFKELGTYQFPIQFFAITDGYLLVTYTNATDETMQETYEEWAMVLDLTGKDYSKLYLASAFFHPITGVWRPNYAWFIVNINPSKGFLRFGPQSLSTNLTWQQYHVNGSGILKKLSEDFTPIKFFTAQVAALSTTDEGYAIIYANTSSDASVTMEDTTNDPFKPYGEIYAVFLSYEQKETPHPVVLYQTQRRFIQFTSLSCNIACVGVGHVCLLTVNITDLDERFYVQINFLSRGTVTGFNTINSITSQNVTIPEFNIRSLPYGGYFMSGFAKQGDDVLLYGYLYDEHGKVYFGDLPKSFPTNLFGSTTILKNNTLVIAQKESIGVWSLNLVDIIKFESDRDHGYENFKIDSTIPQISETIKSTQDHVRINFFESITLSSGYVTIYKLEESDKKLRQRTEGLNNDFVSLDNAQSVKIKIIAPTFNRPGNYTVEVDNNFIKSKAFNEPLNGVRQGLWYFQTEPMKEKKSKSVEGRVRLNPEGSGHFEKLDEDGKAKFIRKLQEELADAILISRDRVGSNEHSQIDVSAPEQIILSIDIKTTDDNNERTVPLAVEDLNTLIVNKFITSLAEGENSKYLDENYGYKPFPNYWEEIRLSLIGMLFVFTAFVILFLTAQRRAQNSKRRAYNLAILQLGLIISDFLLDILFLSKSARDVEWLYIPSLIILIIPTTLNIILAFYIITEENLKNLKFKNWSHQNMKVVSAFTLLAGADIEALNILQSNIADLDMFKAKFSENAVTMIFWAACLDIVVEDIPQVTFQILYYQNVVYYNIIPLLTLISSCITLTINIIGRSYQAIQRIRDEDNFYNPHNTDDDDFGVTDVSKNANLQFKPEHHHDRGGNSLNPEKIKSGKVEPEPVIDPQQVNSNDEGMLKQTTSKSNFQEMIQ